MSMRGVTLPPPSPGFIGDGHIAIHAIGPQDFAHNDPFIVLADDRLDLTRGQQAGAAHPHAGFDMQPSSSTARCATETRVCCGQVTLCGRLPGAA